MSHVGTWSDHCPYRKVNFLKWQFYSCKSSVSTCAPLLSLVGTWQPVVELEPAKHNLLPETELPKIENLTNKQQLAHPNQSMRPMPNQLAYTTHELYLI